jgi:site-specific DNA-methyltransferase (adenine-specific)
MDLNKIYLGDSEVLLKELPDDYVDLVVTSPPYDNLRKYNGVGDTWNHEKFKKIANELERVLKPGGIIVWNVNDKTEGGSETGTSFRQALYFMDECGLRLNDTMIWMKTNPMPQVKQPRYNQVFEYMFVSSKGEPKTLNPIMIPCKCAGQDYDSTCKNMGGESGRTKKHFKINKEKVDDNVWKFAIAQNHSPNPAVYPLELPKRHILSWTNEGDIILDPFIGSGTTAFAAMELDRNFIGFEMNEEYFNWANEKIEEFLEKSAKSFSD